MPPDTLRDATEDLRDPIPSSPLDLLVRWFQEARDCAAIRNADAMALSTVDAEGVPNVRFVLCRGRDLERGRFTFYTHYDSVKGRELASNARASGALYWEALERQVRIRGAVVRAPAADSDAYWSTRPRLSQLSAWASEQSRPVAARADLALSLEEAEGRFRDEAVPIPRPPNWGGYQIEADTIELWAGRPGRLHDRVRWTRSRDDDWSAQRLQP